VNVEVDPWKDDCSGPSHCLGYYGEVQGEAWCIQQNFFMIPGYHYDHFDEAVTIENWSDFGPVVFIKESGVDIKFWLLKLLLCIQVYTYVLSGNLYVDIIL
jgi:hypothetical protein